MSMAMISGGGTDLINNSHSQLTTKSNHEYNSSKHKKQKSKNF